MIAALVLAAGLGTRMGASKPLLDIGGRPSLRCVLDAIAAAGVSNVVVVLGRDADRIVAHVDLARHRVIRNPAPERGLSSSLALGLAAIPASCTGALVFHADMPFVQSSTIHAVSALAREGAILGAPRFAGQRGFPVYLARECFGPLAAGLSGDEGGRRYLDRRQDALRLVDVADPGCLRDVDQPSDLVTEEGSVHWTTSA